MYHVNTFLKEKDCGQINYMTRVLEKHGDVNRINFGDAQWNYFIRPSITHTCAVWKPLSQVSSDLLDSWQYKAALVICHTNLNIPIMPISAI